MIEIRILGPGCPNCLKLEQMVFNACAEANVDADIQKVTDINEFGKYGVWLTPGLIINGKVKLQGKLPTLATLKHWILDGLV